MTVLRICRGLPASGKTTHAMEWLSGDREFRARVNRDDLRAMMHDSVFIPGITEQVIVAARDLLIAACLGRGISVICDDTNLDSRDVEALRDMAALREAEFEIADFTDAPLEVCIRRNAARRAKKPVPESAIRSMHERYLAGSPS